MGFHAGVVTGPRIVAGTNTGLSGLYRPANGETATFLDVKYPSCHAGVFARSVDFNVVKLLFIIGMQKSMLADLAIDRGTHGHTRLRQDIDTLMGPVGSWGVEVAAPPVIVSQ